MFQMQMLSLWYVVFQETFLSIIFTCTHCIYFHILFWVKDRNKLVNLWP